MNKHGLCKKSNNSSISDYIFKGEFEKILPIIEKNEDLGMQTFDQNLFKLYMGSVISYAESLKNATSVNNLKLRIKLAEDAKTSNNHLEHLKILQKG